LRFQIFKIFLCENDVFVFFVLVSFYDVAGWDLAPIAIDAGLFVFDAAHRVFFKHVESDVVFTNRTVQRNRNVYKSECNCAFERVCHGPSIDKVLTNAPFFFAIICLIKKGENKMVRQEITTDSPVEDFLHSESE